MKEKMKTKILFIFKLIIFVTVFILSYSVLTNVFMNKSTAYPDTIYKEDDGFIDVVFVGSSHVYAGIQPMELWNEYGITSCNVATNSQAMGTAYCAISETINEQHPKLVVLDMFGIYIDAAYGSYPDFHSLMDNVEISYNKLKLITSFVPKEDRLRFILNLAEYHARWKELKKEDFVKPKYIDFMKGATFSMANSNTEFQDLDVLEYDKTIEIPLTSRKYLQDIIELCKTTNTELLLITLPYYADGSQIYLKQEYFNEIVYIAEKNNIKYINYFHLLNDIDFDFITDMAEWSHMNYNGSSKVDKHLFKYISDNYNFINHSSDSRYVKWNEDYKSYIEYRDDVLNQKN